MYWTSSPRRGTGWTSESTHRTAMRSAAGTRSCEWVSVISISSLSLFLSILRLAGRDIDRNVDPVQVGRIAPAELLPLLGRQCLGQFVDVAALPVRVARAEHHHVVLAGEAEPLAGELSVAGSVEAALDEVDVSGQVLTGKPGRPWGLLEVRPAEGVHPPHERGHEIRGAIAPDEFQAGEAFEDALGDHVHLVVQVVQRHEADVVLVDPGVAVRGGRIGNSGADLDVRGHWEPRVLGGFPQRPELRLAVDLTRLQRNADLDHPRMRTPFFDLFQSTRDVVGVHPDGAAELVAELAVLQPLRHHHLVVSRVQRAPQMPVWHDAARHRMQNRYVDAAFRKKFIANECR